MNAGTIDQQASISHRIADRALTWVDANLDRFDPFASGNEVNNAAMKSLMELAVLYTSLEGRPAFQNDPRLDRFLALVQATQDHPPFQERVWRTGKDFVPYTLFAIALRRGGPLAGDDRRRLQYLVDHGNAAVTEQVPYRSLEMRQIFDAAGLRHPLPPYATIYRDTTLARGINPSAASNFDAYSLTHTMFYLTDWGSRPPTAIPASHRARHAWLLEQMLGMSIRQGNWDLAGEFLLALHCLGTTGSDIYALGWEALATAQWADGTMPGPTYVPPPAENSPSDKEVADAVFATCCHTTLVAAFAGGICTPPVRP